MVPLSARPPVTQNDAAIDPRKLRSGLRARQARAKVRGVNPVLALALLAPGRGAVDLTPDAAAD